jgi:hypothetical protein
MYGNTYAIVGADLALARQRCDLGHRFDANDTLDGEVRLVRQASREVIRADLVCGNERVSDKELSPLVEEIVLAKYKCE